MPDGKRHCAIAPTTDYESLLWKQRKANIQSVTTFKPANYGYRIFCEKLPPSRRARSFAAAEASVAS